MTTVVCRALILLALCVSCAADAGAPPYRVFILDVEDPAYVGEDVAFVLSERVISGADDFEQLAGPSLRLTRGGSLLLIESAGSVIADGKFSGGSAPDLRYSFDGGVIVARDYSSLAMISAYHHFERAVGAVDTLTDGTAEELVGGEALEILFEPQLRIDGATLTQKLNAFFFHGERRQFGLLQRSALETVSLGTNPLVIAHETGHAVFEWLFHGGKTPECDPAERASNLEDPNFSGRLSVEYSISGFNEGFADFYTFSLYGATNIFSGLGFLDDGERRLTSEQRFADIGGCEGAFYCLGSLLARSLYASYLQLGYSEESPSDRAAFSQQVATALRGTRERMRQADLGMPSSGVASCTRSEVLDTSYDMQVAGVFLAALAEGLPDESRAVFCQQAVFYFGSEGFPSATRGVCLL